VTSVGPAITYTGHAVASMGPAMAYAGPAVASMGPAMAYAGPAMIWRYVFSGTWRDVQYM
jgi:hypothetical protein